jgi:hypothetical protein
VILGREVEDAACADHALEALDGVADGWRVGGTGLLDRLGEDQQGVVGMSAEGAYILLNWLS